MTFTVSDGSLTASEVVSITVNDALPVTSASPNVVTYGITTSRSITIYGSSFALGSTITVGSLSGVTVSGSTALATTPFVFTSSSQVKFYWSTTSLPPGTYDVQVTNPNGVSGVLVGGFTVSPPQPTVTSVTASTVTYGVTANQQVTISGSSFLLGATITVGGVTGTTVAGSSATATTPFVYVNSGQLKFYWTNTSLLPGVYNVQVTEPAAAGGLMGTLTAGFTVNGAQATVTSVSPTAMTYGIAGSSSITVYGMNFVAGATITVGTLSGPTVVGTTASATTPFVWVSSSQVRFYWPNTSLAPGAYAVQVTNTADSGGLSAVLADGFTVTAPQPTIMSLSPAQVTYGITGNSAITIYGSQFIVGATITVGSLSGVTVAGSSATATTPFVYVSSSQLKFYWTNTSLAPNAYGVQMTNPAGAGSLSATLDAGFTVAAPQPNVTSVSPASLNYGVASNTSVTVYGSNFIVGATITVGSLSGATVSGSAATATTPFVYVSSSQLKFYWPNTSLPVGAYAVTVVNPPAAGGLSGSLVAGFTVAAPQPTVSSTILTLVTYGISANQGITIYGSNFVLGATITVGSLSGTTVAGSTASATIPFVFVNTGQLKFYWTNTSLPVGAYTVTVVNPLPAGGLAGSLASGFTVAAPQPTISSVVLTPLTYGVTASQSVTINGSSFIVGGMITVGSLTGTTVAGSTATATTRFVYVSSSQLKFYWPNTALPPAAYAVQVANPSSAGGLSATLANGFTVAAPQPTVTSVSPTPVTYGTTASGAITIYGSNFLVGATITVGSLTGATVAGSTATATNRFVYVNSGQLKFYWGNTALPVGGYTVSVTNPPSAGGVVGSLANGFVVQ